MNRNSSISEIKGVGAKTEELFHKIGVYTVRDILLHYPRTYTQYPKVKHVDEVNEGETAAVLGRITKTPVVESAFHADHRHCDQENWMFQWNWSGFGCLISKTI